MEVSLFTQEEQRLETAPLLWPFPRSLILDRKWEENIPIFRDMALQFFDTDKYGKSLNAVSTAKSYVLKIKFNKGI